MMQKTKRITVDSEYENIRKVVKELVDFVTNHTNLDENALPVALSEAVTNAMVHGNRKDPKKKVSAIASITPQRVIFKVEDEGCGFDYSRLPDPTMAENLKKLHGRGLYLIRCLMDQVQFNEAGNEITMIKCLN